MELYTDVLLLGLKKVKEETQTTFDAFFYQKEPIIRDLIYRRWLLGKKPDGSKIGVYFDQDYRENKYFKNPLAGGDVDLILDGGLWKGIEIFGRKGDFEIFSTDWKYQKIVEKYGIENFNVTDQEQEELTNEISVMTIEYLYNKYIL